VYTDNNPLTWVLSTAKLNATGFCWIGELADFNFAICHRPGKINTNADTLSRLPENMSKYMDLCTAETCQDELRPIIQSIQLENKGKVTWVNLSDIRQAQLKDNVIGKVYSFVNRKQQPTATNSDLLSESSTITGY
jgi:hypothetical protein